MAELPAGYLRDTMERLDVVVPVALVVVTIATELREGLAATHQAEAWNTEAQKPGH
jgi:hypothetical protein